MGDHTTTGMPKSNPTSQVGTHGNADADRADDPAKRGQSQSGKSGQPGQQVQRQGSDWSDQDKGYQGGQAERDMAQGDRTSPPQPSGTTPLEHEGRPKA